MHCIVSLSSSTVTHFYIFSLLALYTETSVTKWLDFINIWPIYKNTNLPMDTDNRVAPPIQFVYWFGLQNLRRHMCCRAIKTKLIGVTSITYQCQHSNFAKVGSMFCQIPDKLSEKYPRCFNFCRSGEISPNLVTLTPTHTHFFTQYT